MGHWIFFSTGFEYKIKNEEELKDMKEFFGEVMYMFLPYNEKEYCYYLKNYENKNINKYEIKECICCYENIDSNFVIFPCHHGLCYSCFRTLTNKKKQYNCPNCRNNIIKSSIEQEIHRSIGKNINLNEEVFLTEDEYKIVVNENKKLEHFIEKCIIWDDSKINEMYDIISNDNLEIDFDIYDSNTYGTKMIMEEFNNIDEIEYTNRLRVLIYHQLLYSERLIVYFNE